MDIYICVCIYIYIYIYIHTHIHTHALTHIHIYIIANVCCKIYFSFVLIIATHTVYNSRYTLIIMPLLGGAPFSKLWDRKSPEIPRTLLSILADIDNVVVWMFSTYRLISKSSSSFINPLGIAPSAPITIGITVTFILPSLVFISLTRYRYLFFFSLFQKILLCGPTGR